MKNLSSLLNESLESNRTTITEAKSNTVRGDFLKACTFYYVGEEAEGDAILSKLLKGLQNVKPAIVEKIYNLDDKVLAKDYAKIIEEIATVLGCITEMCKDADDSEDFDNYVTKITCFTDGGDESIEVAENVLNNLEYKLESDGIDYEEELDNVVQYWDDVCMTVFKKHWV